MNPLRTLIQLSHTIGRDPLLVQAGGGNISIKENNQAMLIKASGIRLKHVQVNRGWARSQFRALVRQLPGLYRSASVTRRELRYADLLGDTGKTKGWRVSMEAGFHAVMPARCVVHLHSVAGILLGLMPRAVAARMIQDEFGPYVQVQIVPPSIPGLELTHHVAKQLHSSKPGARVNLWILQNHGIIWTAQKSDDIIRASDRLEKTLRSRFHLKAYSLPHLAGSAGCQHKPGRVPHEMRGASWREICLCHWPACFFELRPLFPDFTIYFDLWGKTPPDLIKTWARGVHIRSLSAEQFQNQKEVFFAHALVSTVAHQQGWLRPLPVRMIRAIKGLETERLRLAQAATA